MPNTKSAAKAARQSKRRAVRNQAVKSKVRTLEKKFLASVASGNADTADKAYRDVISAYGKAAKTGVLKRGTASRKQSRLRLKLNVVLAAKK
jgi:small subunit ribosomal protein S20